MDLKFLSQETYKRASWKNGLGFTAEIAIHPPGSSLKEGDFLWRVSSARIEKASPFSEFPFHDRSLVILEGGGIRLFHSYEPGEPAEQVDLPALEPYEFPGDVPSRCELSEGPVTDVSVFIRKAEAEAITEVLSLEPGETREWKPEGRWNFIFVAEGGLEIAGHSARRHDTIALELRAPLPQGEAVVMHAPDGATLVRIALSA